MVVVEDPDVLGLASRQNLQVVEVPRNLVPSEIVVFCNVEHEKLRS